MDEEKVDDASLRREDSHDSAVNDNGPLPNNGVHFDSPFDIPPSKKWLMTLLMALMTFTVSFGSSIFSSTTAVTSKEFDVSETVMILGVSLYVLGFALGPLVWGPLSEILGRRTPMFLGFGLFALMQIPTALSPTLPGIFICRFLAGAFGASPVVLVSTSYADFWEPAERGTATALYSAAAYVGPTVGPIAGALITNSTLGWRWTAWLVLIMAAFFGIPAFFVVPETYGPVLKQRALRKLEQGQQAVVKKSGGNDFVRRFMIRPIQMLGSELMLDVMTIYISISYGIMYLTYYAFPYAFMHDRGWSPTISSLPFASYLVGILLACAGFASYMQIIYQQRLRARGGKVVPEDRLPPVMVGALILPAGLFWFAWTSNPDIPWIVQVIPGALIGSGIMLIFSGGVAFIVDIYLESSASALALNTFVRSFTAAGLPLAAPKMYETLGVSWATTTLGFFCVALAPAPFIFSVYGARLRKYSRFARSP